MATVKAQGLLPPHTARSLPLTFRAFALLLLLGALLTGFPMPAWAQTFTHTQVTNTTVGFNRSSSINSDGTRIAFASNRDLTGGNADGQPGDLSLDLRLRVYPDHQHNRGLQFLLLHQLRRHPDRLCLR